MRERAEELGGTWTIESAYDGAGKRARAIACLTRWRAAAGRLMMEPIRVLIADDHPLFRDGLRGAAELDARYGGRGRGARPAKRRSRWRPASSRTSS